MVMVMMILMITNDMIMTIRRFEQRRQEFRMWNAKVSGKLQMRKRLVMIMVVVMIIISSCYQTGHFPTMYMVITNIVVAIVGFPDI